MAAAEAAPVAVVGCGVIGLAAALHLKRRHPNVPVHIISNGAVEDTTSYGSGGTSRHCAPDASLRLVPICQHCQANSSSCTIKRHGPPACAQGSGSRTR